MEKQKFFCPLEAKTPIEQSWQTCYQGFANHLAMYYKKNTSSMNVGDQVLDNTFTLSSAISAGSGG